MFGSYYGTNPAQTNRMYVDTSQSLMGLGDDGMLTIYEGVGAAPSALAKPGGCGCNAGLRGKLAGFGNEVFPDAIPPLESTLNLRTGLTALLVAGTIAAVGFFLFSGGSSMRANGKKKSKVDFRTKVFGRKKLRGKRYSQRHAYSPSRTHVSYQRSGGKGWTSYKWSNGSTQCFLYATGSGPAHTIAMVEKSNDGRWKAYLDDGGGDRRIGASATAAGARGIVERTLSGEAYRKNAPRFLLSKKGKSTKKQSVAGAQTLAGYRWGTEPRSSARWGGKHMAHYRFKSNASKRNAKRLRWDKLGAATVQDLNVVAKGLKPKLVGQVAKDTERGVWVACVKKPGGGFNRVPGQRTFKSKARAKAAIYRIALAHVR